MHLFLSKIRRKIYTSWLAYAVDLILVTVFVLMCIGLYFASSKKSLFTLIASWSSIIPFVWALFHHVSARFDAQKTYEAVQTELEPYFTRIEHALTSHLISIDQEKIVEAEEKTCTRTLQRLEFGENIEGIEYEVVNFFLDSYANAKAIPNYQKLFLEYRIITSEFQDSFTEFVKHRIHLGSLKSNVLLRQFGKLLFSFERNPEISIDTDLNFISDEQSEEALFNTFEISSKRFQDILKNEEERNKAETLLHKAIENAYTNIGKLHKSSQSGNRKVPLLFKYDEKYAEVRKKWEKAIAIYVKKQNLAEHQEAETTAEINKKIQEILKRQPFSQALVSFKGAVRQIGRDYFLYLIDVDSFPPNVRGHTPESFITKHVLPKARQIQTDTNKELLKHFPFLKGKLKRRLDANYYIIYFDPSDVKIKADPKSTPRSLKIAFSKSLFSEADVDKLASQLVYIKQVIHNLTLSGLLFTESFEKQEQYRKAEKRILNACEKAGINVRTLIDISQIGNQSANLINIIFGILHKTKKPSPRSKFYREVKADVETILTNATQVLAILQKLKSKK